MSPLQSLLNTPPAASLQRGSGQRLPEQSQSSALGHSVQCGGVWAHRCPAAWDILQSLLQSVLQVSQHKKYHGKGVCLVLHCISSLLYCHKSGTGTDTILKTPDAAGMTYSGFTYTYHTIGQKKAGKRKIINSRSINGIGNLWATPFWGVSSPVIKVWMQSTEMSPAWPKPGCQVGQSSRVYSTSACRVLPLCLWLPAFFVTIFKRSGGVGTTSVNIFSNSWNYLYKLSLPIIWQKGTFKQDPNLLPKSSCLHYKLGLKW